MVKTVEYQLQLTEETAMSEIELQFQFEEEIRMGEVELQLQLTENLRFLKVLKAWEKYFLIEGSS